MKGQFESVEDACTRQRTACLDVREKSKVTSFGDNTPRQVQVGTLNTSIVAQLTALLTALMNVQQCFFLSFITFWNAFNNLKDEMPLVLFVWK